MKPMGLGGLANRPARRQPIASDATLADCLRRHIGQALGHGLKACVVLPFPGPGWPWDRDHDSACGQRRNSLQVKMPNNKESRAKPAIPTRASRDVEEGIARSGGCCQC